METANLLTVKDVAEKLGVKEQLVYRLKSEHKIPHVQIGGVIRFRPSDIEEWLEKSVVR